MLFQGYLSWRSTLPGEHRVFEPFTGSLAELDPFWLIFGAFPANEALALAPGPSPPAPPRSIVAAANPIWEDVPAATICGGPCGSAAPLKSFDNTSDGFVSESPVFAPAD
ncbi:hypothetical protein CSOJ01_13772 [Colletotrichum sojae]|uniref:Uncharacterized protein n=1 Tax=Colletotrichum sojae TaxID=2175907 RepID=A0A8H6MKR2_9PEZI|nr:hypothetical protein CSOJ01_13772 [Colletotrichum sojae]